MSERYYAKRAAGISELRRDGSRRSAETDRQSAAAEEFAARKLGAEFNSEVYADHGDGGCDFVLGGHTVEVIWAGFELGLLRPRLTGNLIVSPDEPQRHAQLYVVVVGSIEAGFSLAGWLDHETLVELPLRDFGYGPRYACEIRDLRWFREGVLRS